GKGLTALLKDHIMIAVDLIEAAKKGDNAAFATHDQRWSDNANQIANFLAGANPHWRAADVKDLLDLHLNLTKGEVVARLQQNWEADVKAFDDIFTEAMFFADPLHAAFVPQFREKFGRALAGSVS